MPATMNSDVDFDGDSCNLHQQVLGPVCHGQSWDHLCCKGKFGDEDLHFLKKIHTTLDG